MGFLGSIFDGDNSEILFFILVFLFLFNGNLFGKDGCTSGDDNSTILFFIILFLLLFFNGTGFGTDKK